MILPNADEEGSKPKIKPKKEEIPILDTSTVSDTMPSSETPPAELYPEQQEPKKTRKRIEDFTKEEAYALAKLLKFKIAEKRNGKIVNKKFFRGRKHCRLRKKL